MLGARVAQRELAPTAAASQQPGQQRVAVLGGAMVPAARYVVADHPADRLRSLPIDIPFVRTRLQCQPFRAWLAAPSGARPDAVIAGCDAGLAIGVGPAVDRVGDHPVDAGVAGSTPNNRAVGWSCR